MSAPVQVTLRSERPFELIDVTDDVRAAVEQSGLADGIVHVFCPHTSCGLAVTELEDGLHRDFEALLERFAPVDGHYEHDDLERRTQNLEPDERRNGWSHMRALTGTHPSVTAPVLEGRLGLGQWQRVFLVELDGPRPRRTLVVQAWGRLKSSQIPHDPGSYVGGPSK